MILNLFESELNPVLPLSAGVYALTSLLRILLENGRLFSRISLIVNVPSLLQLFLEGIAFYFRFF